ncbi:MAG: hypothetical protein ABFR75_05955 [Acidobacteriota bacterium]
MCDEHIYNPTLSDLKNTPSGGFFRSLIVDTIPLGLTKKLDNN